MIRKTLWGAALATIASTSHAQERTGWITVLEGAYAGQGSSSLSGGGTFNVDRTSGRIGGLYRSESGNSVGVFGTLGQSKYAFSEEAPWGRINERAVTVSLGFSTESGTRFFIAPSIRSRFEAGSSFSDGQTYGFFAGASWEFSESLTIGPAFGAFTEIGTDDITFFPALIVDWDINDKFNLSTGRGLGASQGPGLTLSYAVNDDWSVSLTGRSEKSRFSLSQNGLSSGGVGEDTSVPVVVSLGYNPNPGLSLVGFAGAELNGQLKSENEAGAEISSQSYDTAPVFGFMASIGF